MKSRIKFFRNLRGMTQKQLGMTVGFSIEESDASVCLRLNERNDRLYHMLLDWYAQAALLSCGKIDQTAYDQ